MFLNSPIHLHKTMTLCEKVRDFFTGMAASLVYTNTACHLDIPEKDETPAMLGGIATSLLTELGVAGTLCYQWVINDNKWGAFLYFGAKVVTHTAGLGYRITMDARGIQRENHVMVQLITRPPEYEWLQVIIEDEDCYKGYLVNRTAFQTTPQVTYPLSETLASIVANGMRERKATVVARSPDQPLEIIIRTAARIYFGFKDNYDAQQEGVRAGNKLG